MPLPLPFRRSKNLSPSEYSARVQKGLNDAHSRNLKNGPAETIALEDLRVVIFSDLHRGARDPVDDFQPCEAAYSAALGWYRREGYELWLLGDVEELWKNDYPEVLRSYGALLELESSFDVRKGGKGLRRFYGNHDIDWSRGKFLKRLRKAVGWDIDVHESLLLKVTVEDPAESGSIFLVHGHQGDPASDRLLWLSRVLVRRLWRKVQEAKGLLSTTPAQSYDLRAKHDDAMYDWACNQPAADALILIAGHTHHPIWTSRYERPTWHPEQVKAELDAALANQPADDDPDYQEWRDQVDHLAAEHQRHRAEKRYKRYQPPPVRSPSYFNSGCCCFPDRDVTCIELADSQMRLVRWLDDEGKARPERKGPAESLTNLFAAIRAR
jgi:hypothetical protein